MSFSAHQQQQKEEMMRRLFWNSWYPSSVAKMKLSSLN
jgi:hypothetical protein